MVIDFESCQQIKCACVDIQMRIGGPLDRVAGIPRVQLVWNSMLIIVPDGRGGGSMGRSSSMGDFGDQRGGHQSNLQNFYASQRQQSSRGSNEAEQAMQVKRRLAAQRERELRNYHQEQQYNRSRPPPSV